MKANELTIASLQQHIEERYAKVDRARGWEKTFAYFIEEIGELATALTNREKDKKNLEEEFADVIAWLCTLANITDVDLSASIRRKYLGKRRPKGTK